MANNPNTLICKNNNNTKVPWININTNNHNVILNTMAIAITKYVTHVDLFYVLT